MIDDVMRYIWLVSWQTGILAVAIWMIIRLARNAPASWRHALWVIVLVKFLIPPVVHFPSELAVWQKPQSVGILPENVQSVPYKAEMSGAAVTPSPATSQQVATTDADDVSRQLSGSAVLLLAWFAGVSVMAGMLLKSCMKQLYVRRRTFTVDDDIRYLLLTCAGCLGVRRLPDIVSSESVRIPALIGLIRPAIVLPVDIRAPSVSSETRAILLHELAHIKRRDMLVMWLQQFVQCIFFFHPALWLASREIRREREMACDELVISSVAISPEDYAAGYISVLKRGISVRKFSASLAMAEPFSVEQRRLEMILRNAVPRFSRRLLAVLVMAVVVGLPTFVGTRTIFAQRDAARSTADDILSAWRDQETARGGSVEVDYVVSFSVKMPDGRQQRGLRHYVWTPAGRRMEINAEYSSDGKTWTGGNGSTTISIADNDYRMLGIGPGHAPEGKIDSFQRLGHGYVMDDLIETTAEGLIGKPLYVQFQGGQVARTKEKVGKHDCWKVVRRSFDVTFTAWCDPEIGYAPRRLKITGDGSGVTDIQFDNYKEIRSSFWFPMRMEKVRQTANDQRFAMIATVQKIRAGRSISVDKLRVDFPPGTKVTDKKSGA